MIKKFKEKYNEGCIKVFKLLLMLYNNEAKYEDVIKIFGESPKGEKQHVMLNKFLNSLKIFGIEIEKKKNVYTMQNMPFSVMFDIDDLKAIAIFEKLSQYIANDDTREGFIKFLKYVQMHFDSDTTLKYKNILENNSEDYSFYYKDLKEQILKCEGYIKQNFKIRLKYFNSRNEECECYCTPKEIVYDNKHVYLRVYNQNDNVVDDVKITNITGMEYLPTVKTDCPTAMTVAFRLKGRLAKAYTLKNGERISEYGEDGSILVINQNEPIDALLARLLRYDKDCVIERPKSLRLQMKKIIQDSLKNYE